MREVTFELISPLITVQNKEDLLKICNWATSENDRFGDAIQKTSQILLIDENRAKDLLKSLNVIYHRCSSSDSSTTQRQSIFPNNFPSKFSTYLIQIMTNSYKEVPPNTLTQIFVPKMVRFDWQVRVKTSSSNKSSPTCLFKIEIQPPDSTKDKMESKSICTFEMSKETINIVLDSFKKIHELLSNIAA